MPKRRIQTSKKKTPAPDTMPSGIGNEMSSLDPATFRDASRSPPSSRGSPTPSVDSRVSLVAQVSTVAKDKKDFLIDLSRRTYNEYPARALCVPGVGPACSVCVWRPSGVYMYASSSAHIFVHAQKPRRTKRLPSSLDERVANDNAQSCFRALAVRFTRCDWALTRPVQR
ncbi:hypothetical protein EYF80_063986 [Liparis tanakae]|uniref:Uncharacterized protein n=1 Tax=Liparis tanakae TaxID=230148 RepID=A0A4Z2EAN4_9TELE|nr:hypothetical protein EYF80_063986 [Liparis tanakae]